MQDDKKKPAPTRNPVDELYGDLHKPVDTDLDLDKDPKPKKPPVSELP